MSSDHSPNPVVSVIVPVYNSEKFIGMALESIRAQDYPGSALEVIIVDDGSTDKTAEILDAYCQSWRGQIKLLRHPTGENRGIAASYRLALKHCQGKYIAFLEHDDFWATSKISEQVKIFQKYPEVGVVFSDVHPCDIAGKISAKPFRGIVNRPPSDAPFDDAFWRLLWGNFVLTFSNFMLRRDFFDESDIILEPQGFQEWMLLLLLSKRCHFFHCSRTRTFWRQRADSYHRSLGHSADYKRKRLSIIRMMLSDKSQSGFLRIYFTRKMFGYLASFRHLIARNSPIRVT